MHLAQAASWFTSRIGLLGILAAGHALGMNVTVESSAPEPSAVGATINLYASIADVAPGDIWYRFRIRPANSAEYRVIRDYSPESTFDWTPTGAEGSYEIEVSARNRETGETTDSIRTYRVDPRVTNDAPVITPTRNLLVFLYSAPACPEGSQMRVTFVAPEGLRQSTPEMACNGMTSMNVYLAGLQPDRQYAVQHVISAGAGSQILGPLLSLRTEPLDFPAPATRTLQSPAGEASQGLLLQSNVFSTNVVTDLQGNIVWYNLTPIRYLTRVERSGHFVAIYDNWFYDESAQILRILDVAGNVVAETNAAFINEQLAAAGKAPITSFHHDARVLDDGRILVLAGNERIMSGVQGPGEVDIIGDAILVLNRDLQVEWSWDAFDHLDVRRKAILGETCSFGSGGCPVFYLASTANDWLHGNSVQLTPDGHILYSSRHQDWLIKIDYANGAGSGNVLWRLGRDGDFQMQSDDPYPWFSHQHDGNFESGAPNRLIVLDNGNTHFARNPAAHSRGQVLEIDEAARTAKLALNADLGDYSRALGSAEKIENGNYNFGLGWMSNGFSQALEFTPDGQLVTRIEAETQMYRAYRLRDLYTPRP